MRKRFLKGMLGVFLICIVFFGVSGKTVEAAQTCDVYVKGYELYGEIQTILDETNRVREEKGIAPLKIDWELTKIAMQRAAECAVEYNSDHSRPNGEECYEAWTDAGYPSGYKKAENEAYGYGVSADDIAQAWINSSDHYASMINANYKSIGIGGFYQSGGTYFWVQEFSSKAASNSSIPYTTNQLATHKVEIDSTVGNFFFGDDKGSIGSSTVFGVGETRQIRLYRWAFASGTGAGKPTWFTNLKWSSSNSSIVGIEASTGSLTVKNAGGPITITCETTAGANGLYRRLQLNNLYSKKLMTDVVVTGIDSTYPYTGSAVVPNFKLSFKNQTLSNGTDYTYTITNNTGVGTAQITITGLGDYSGEIQKTFYIKKLDAEDKAIITMDTRKQGANETTQAYLEDVVHVTFEGRTLTLEKDYWLDGVFHNEKYDYYSFRVEYKFHYGGGYQNVRTMNAFSISPIADQQYTGKVIQPSISLGSPAGYSVRGMQEGVTHSVTWKNNIEAGTAEVILKGNGINYVGEISQTFKIVKPAKVKITFNANGGKVSTESKKITKGSQIGSLPKPTRKGYKFKGWYTKKTNGTKVTTSKTFSKKTTLYAQWSKITVKKASLKKLTVGKKSLKVTFNKVSGAAGYQIRYSTKSDMSGAKTVTVSGTSKTIKKLTKKKQYYVQVRAYKKDSAGKKVYGKWSTKMVSKKIK